MGYSCAPLSSKKSCTTYKVGFWGVYDVELFDEQPRAWLNGPVYETIHEEYKSSKVSAPIRKSIPDAERFLENHSHALGIELDANKLKFLRDLLDHYLSLPVEKLVMMTHNEPPWQNARGALSPFERSDDPIPMNSLKVFFGKYADNVRI